MPVIWALILFRTVPVPVDLRLLDLAIYRDVDMQVPTAK